MTHTSGLAYGATNSRSDFEWMKSQIAAGTTRIGQYSYQNMNFGLCRILLATINGNIPVDWTMPGWLGWLFGNEFNDIFWDLITIRAYAAYVAGPCLRAGGRDRTGIHPRCGGRPGLQLPCDRKRVEFRQPDDDGRRSRMAHVGRRTAQGHGDLPA